MRCRQQSLSLQFLLGTFLLSARSVNGFAVNGLVAWACRMRG